MEYYEPADESHKRRERQKARELRKSQWWRLKLAQGVCYHCEKSFAAEELTMDHLVPVSRGGRSNKGNLVASCKPCNTAKKHLTPAEIRLAGLKSQNKLS